MQRILQMSDVTSNLNLKVWLENCLRNDMPVLGLAGCHFGKMKTKQVRLHDSMDGSSLARAIHVPTGPLLKIRLKNQTKIRTSDENEQSTS